MPNFYTSSAGQPSGGGGGFGGGSSSFSDPFGVAAKSAPSASKGEDEEFDAAGKVSINMGDIINSVGEGIGNIGDFVAGIAGPVGEIGIPGGPNLGDVAELPGKAVDAAGQIGFGDGQNLGALPGAAADLVSAPGRFVEGEAAKSRLRNEQGTGTVLDQLIANVTGSFNPLAPGLEGSMRQIAEARQRAGQPLTAQEQQLLGKFAIPEDIQARLDAGESIDDLANEMVETGRGFSNDFAQNITTGLVFDPLNLIGPGVGAVRQGAKGAGIAVKAAEAGERLGVGTRLTGTMYNAASRGLSAGGARLMDGLIGPTTSGVFHALGTRPYFAIKNGVSRIAPEYGQAFEDAFARGAAQLPRAVMARYMADEATQAIKNYGKGALSRLPGDVGGTIEARLGAIRRINPGQIERRTEELLNRTVPDFLGHTDEARFVETRNKLAAITGMSSEDAARALNGKANLRTAQQVHLAFYGKAGDDLARAKSVASGAKNIDSERLTLVAPDTLTDELASDLLQGRGDIETAVDQFSVLRNRFGGTNFDHEEVRSFVAKLHDEGALTKAVRAPVTGKDALPDALKGWQRQYERFGYNIGFAPKDGWKTIIDNETGDVIYADPFVHFVSEAEPLTTRNPLGRFMDSLFRGSTQTSIIQDSRDRMVRLTRSSGISPNEARAVHQRIIQTAADAKATPRALVLSQGADVYADIFKDVLGPERYAKFIAQGGDPDWLTMAAFQGNLRRVGLTQAFTGKLKTASAGRGNVAATIAEGIYPKLRFELSPLFQAQELGESPFLNALRGVQVRAVSDDVAKAYEELSDLPDFRYLTEAGYFLHIAGGQEVGRTLGRRSIIGKALSKVPNVKAYKERQRVAQVFYEHGENFENAVNSINPRLWKRMTEAYGTTDARIIADRFIQERMALASGNMDEAMAVFDAAKPSLIQKAYDAGDVATGQRLNVEAGIARGGNGAGGAMKLTPDEMAKLGIEQPAGNFDAETVWQAFRESFRQSSEQAFKTHYFNPTRGFLERTVNHPYLGLYPASYMWGKVLPEFARFLLKRPFGLDAPLTGAAALSRVQQRVIATTAIDPEFASTLEENEDFIYLIDQMLPGTPSNLPSNLPAWARHLAQDNLEGREMDPQRFIQREAADTFAYAAGPVRTANVGLDALGDLGDVAGDIFAQLTKSAQEYDSQFGVPR